MIKRVNGFFVVLNHVIESVMRYELRPNWILQYLNEQFIERTSFLLYGCTAVVPRAAINRQCTCSRFNDYKLQSFDIASVISTTMSLCIYVKTYFIHCVPNKSTFLFFK